MISPGIYKATPIDNAICATKKGSEYIGVVFEVAEGDHKGEKITASLWWTEKTETRTRGDLATLGWDGMVGSDENGKARLQGLTKTVPIGVVEETYEGKTSLKVSWIGAPPSGIGAESRLTMREAGNLLRAIGAKASGGAKPAAVNGTRPKTPPANAGDSWEGDDENPI